MLGASFVLVTLAGLGVAAPWPVQDGPIEYPTSPEVNKTSPRILPDPTLYQSYPFPSGSHVLHGPIPVTASASVPTETVATSVSSGPGACASVSQLVASFTSASPSAAYATIPAQVAYDCLHEIPFNQSAAVALMDSIKPYVDWQTSISYLKSPPTEYAEKIQPPYDFWAAWDAVYANATAGAYASEYEFGWPLYKLFQNAHDGHFSFYPDSVSSIFTFGRTTALVSLSADGESIPQPYVYADVLAASSGNADFTPSYITEINGENAVDYLLAWSQCGTLQDRDALWNNLFYIPAQVSLGSAGSGTGTFSGGSRGRYIFPGPTTSFTFANGTSVTHDNFARVLIDFADISTGADIYQTYFVTPPEAGDNAFDLLKSATSTGTAATSSTVSTTRTTPAPGYPTAVVRNPNNENSGYFLSGAGYDDVAVLAIPSFLGTNETEFQNVNSELIAAAVASNKTKLIIDVSANGGGTILQGYDLFKQLFPSILPYGATRFRAHEAFNLLGEESSALSARWPRSLDENYTVQDIESSTFNYRTDVDINYEPFTSWSEKYGPHAYGPSNDNFTSIIRWNLSDVLITDDSSGIEISGYGDRSDVTVQPFAPENIIIVYDGFCASTCTIFSELMRQQAGIKTIALGGRPNTDIIQAVGGIKGTNDYPLDYIFSAIEEVYSFSDSSQLETANESVLGSYNQLLFYRSTYSSVNVRDGIREGDEDEVPLQFRYEEADCRIFYTQEMVVDESVVWKTVADTVWNGKSACVAGNNDFYGSGNGTGKRDVEEKTKYEIREDVDFEALWDSLSVTTVGHTKGGDGMMVL